MDKVEIFDTLEMKSVDAPILAPFADGIRMDINARGQFGIGDVGLVG